MKNILLISILFFVFSFASFAEVRLDNPTGYSRDKARFTLPASHRFDADKKWPMILILHGFGSEAVLQERYFALSQHVDSRGFIIVTPQGTKTPDGTKWGNLDISGFRFWNATDFCCDIAKTGVNDVTYLNDLIDHAVANYNVDPKRVFLLGHSNGGFMSARLSCEIGKKLAGVISLAGGSYLHDSQCARPVPVKFAQIHAVNDQVVNYKSKRGSPYKGGLDTIIHFLGRNNCIARPSSEQTIDLVTNLPGNDTKVKKYSVCRSGKPVEFWTIKKRSAKGYDPHIPGLGSQFAESVFRFFGI